MKYQLPIRRTSANWPKGSSLTRFRQSGHINKRDLYEWVVSPQSLLTWILFRFDLTLAAAEHRRFFSSVLLVRLPRETWPKPAVTAVLLRQPFEDERILFRLKSTVSGYHSWVRAKKTLWQSSLLWYETISGNWMRVLRLVALSVELHEFHVSRGYEHKSENTINYQRYINYSLEQWVKIHTLD